jgi:hypothetical protein
MTGVSAAVAALIGALRGAVDDLLAVDAQGFGDADVHRLAVEVHREVGRLALAGAQVLGEWDARRVWAANGSKSAAARLARETRTDPAAAKACMARARRVRRLPRSVAAVADGTLSLDQFDVIAQADSPERAALLAEHEAGLVEQVVNVGTYRDTIRVVRHWIRRADALVQPQPDAPDPDERPERRLHASTLLDGVVVLDGALDKLGGAMVCAELDRLVAQLREEDRASGNRRTAAQRRADALVQMAKRSATMPADGTPPVVLVSVLVGSDHVRGLCELANGVSVELRDLASEIDAAMIESLVFDGSNVMLTMSRARFFVDRLRRAIQLRDRHCQHPSGCDEPAERCDIDHAVPHSEGGPTSQFNGRALCPPHNRHSDLRDRNAQPLPEEPVTPDRVAAARQQWRREHGDASPPPPPPLPPVPLPQSGDGWHPVFRDLAWPTVDEIDAIRHTHDVVRTGRGCFELVPCASPER